MPYLLCYVCRYFFCVCVCGRCCFNANNFLKVVLSCLSIVHEKTTIENVREIRKKFFWANKSNVKIFVYSHYLLWIATIALVISMYADTYLPPYIYKDDWGCLTKFSIRLFVYLYIAFGFYMADTHECFYAYTILHVYFQLNTLNAYLLHEFHRKNKNQNEINCILLRCIKQHKRVTE